VPVTSSPAVRDRLGARLLRAQDGLRRSERLPPEELERTQFRRLEKLLDHAVAHVPFYRERASRYALPRPWDREMWQSLPIIDRAEVQEGGAAFRSLSLPPGHGPAVEIHTSGSTGRPLTGLTTEVTRFQWVALTLREHLWQERDFSLKLASIRPDRLAPGKVEVDFQDWGDPVARVYRTGRAALMTSSVPVPEQLNWLCRRQPGYLLSLPSNLRALAVESMARGAALADLRQVRAYGETLTDDTRRICREAWGVDVADVYSTQEAGYIAFQCTAGSYHIQMESCLVEVLDEAGSPCSPGQAGRVVVTPLYNFAMPLIRYSILDYAETGAPCPCGRTLPTLRRIVGRERNMARRPDGTIFWPSFPAEVWLGVAAVRQLQMVQTALDSIEVRLVVAGEFTADHQSALVTALTRTLNWPYRFTFRLMEEIPRHPSGKFEDFICQV
jgi:phenylacetate-CoA ligase